LRLIDMTVLNNSVSAYVITAGRVLKQVVLFLSALAFSVFAFACTVTSLMESSSEFKGVPLAALGFFMTAFHMEDAIVFDKLKHDGTLWIFTCVCIFICIIDIFLINLLIAQICSEYAAVYDDMVGLARRRKISCIYYTMPYVNLKRWGEWVASLKLDTRLEFNQGDVGLAGGVQITEPANLNPTLIDAIFRFGGSTKRSAPWPAVEDDEDKEKQGFERLEKMMAKIGKRLDEVKGSKGHTGSPCCSLAGIF